MGITTVTQPATPADQPIVTEALKRIGALVPQDPLSRNFETKYVFDIEGNYTAFRLPRLLRSHCLLFKPEFIYHEYYYRWLEPFVHYVPVKVDLSDLAEQLSWARSHDTEARAMAERATRFAEQYLNGEFAADYLQALLQAYAERYRPCSS